jgi:hypothetical protein
MSEAGRPILTRPSSITIIALVLLLMISFSWNGCARARMDAQLAAETEQLAMQQEEQSARLRAAGNLRVEQLYRTMAVPLGWAVRAEAIDEDFKQIEEYAARLLKEPGVTRVAFITPAGIVRQATDRKLQGKPASDYYGEILGQQDIALEKNAETGDLDLLVPILGYSSRLGALIVSFELESEL